MITAKQRTEMLRGYGDVLTIKDVMNILHLGEKSVRKMLREGILRSVFIGQKYIIPKVYLIDFLTDERNLVKLSEKVWTSERSCGIVGTTAKDAAKVGQIPANTKSNKTKKEGESA